MKQKLTIATILTAAIATPALADTECPTPTDTAIAIEDARLYVEDNVPDKDVGVHGFFGDTAWRVLCVYGPDGREIISFQPSGSLGELGVAEFFFESNEPPYDRKSGLTSRTQLSAFFFEDLLGPCKAGISRFTPEVIRNNG